MLDLTQSSPTQLPPTQPLSLLPLSLTLPSSTKDIVGRSKEVELLRNFVLDFKKQKKKAVLIYGLSGVGKTSLVITLAKEFDLELVEVNASDTRNAEGLETRVLPAATQRSFFSSGKIILIDEADALSGTADRGGVSSLVSIIEKSVYPIIITANDISEDKMRPLLKLSQLVEIMPLSSMHVISLLKAACVRIGATVADDVLKTIAFASGGDVRAAYNDLEIVSAGGGVELLSSRERTIDMRHALSIILKTSDIKQAMESLNDVDEDVDQQFFWIDHNMPKEYTNPQDLIRAYGCLTRADVFRRRIRRNQEWRLMVYVNALLGAGICCAKEKPYRVLTEYDESLRALRIWQVNMSNAKRKLIAQKIAQATHTSTRRAFTQIDYFKVLFKKKAPIVPKIVTQLDLSEEEVAWLSA